MRAAALCDWVLGLGFGLPAAYGTWYFAAHDHVWTFLGFPTYGRGPLEDVGIETTVPLLVAFVVVCVAEIVVGWMLWQRSRAATSLSLVMLPLELAFWIGFALPFGLVLGIARTVLVVMAWSSSRRAPEP